MGDDVATRFDDIGPLLKNRGITPMLVKWEVELLSSCSHGERRVLEWTMRHAASASATAHSPVRVQF
jgi:hypothetical protein